MGKVIDYNDEIIKYENKILTGTTTNKKQLIKHYEKLKLWKFIDLIKMSC